MSPGGRAGRQSVGLLWLQVTWARLPQGSVLAPWDDPAGDVGRGGQAEDSRGNGAGAVLCQDQSRHNAREALCSGKRETRQLWKHKE